MAGDTESEKLDTVVPAAGATWMSARVIGLRKLPATRGAVAVTRAENSAPPTAKVRPENVHTISVGFETHELPSRSDSSAETLPPVHPVQVMSLAPTVGGMPSRTP